MDIHMSVSATSISRKQLLIDSLFAEVIMVITRNKKFT